MEPEYDNKINFLDLTITRKDKELEFNIFRKQTTTDIAIHNDSHHPIEQKMSVFRSLIDRLLNVPLKNEDYICELNIIKQIAINNGYKHTFIDKMLKKHKKRLLNKKEAIQAKHLKHNIEKRYIAAKYTSIMPKILKSVLKNKGYTVSFKTNNKIQHYFKQNKDIPVHQQTGIYKITCSDCDCCYIGQSGRGMKQRFSEHIPKNTSNYLKSNYAQHLIDMQHRYTSFEENLQILHRCKKGKLMDSLEEYEIYKEIKNNNTLNLLNDQINFASNVLFDTALSLRDNMSVGAGM